MFATTRWSLVVAAGGATPSAREALAELCRLYWYALYGYARRQGHSHEEAEDLTQGFVASLLERDDLHRVDPARGRFRSFLLAAFQHYLSNQRDRERALKRGGGRHPLSFDLPGAEARYEQEPADTRTPEREFERRWALGLLTHVLDRLRKDYVEAGKGELYEHLQGSLTGAARPYAEVAAALGMSEGAVKVAAHRLRQRYGELLREEVSQTLEDPDGVEDEIQALFAALSA